MTGTTALEAPAIRFVGVSKTFARAGTGEVFRAVDDLDLDIGEGELVAILGKTGCGKSTMFNMIAGLTEPTTGTVLVNGRDPFGDFGWFRGKIAIVFQNDRLLPWRTAIGNVELGLEMLDMPQAERRAIAGQWLTKLGLGGHENDYPHALSGGMRQRVSISRAFATNAGILLCDEPFSALDEMTAHKLRQEFVRLVRENGKTAVFITHSINEALDIGDRIIVLHRPARIALDARVDRGMPEPERLALRTKIMDILGLQDTGASDNGPAGQPALPVGREQHRTRGPHLSCGGEHAARHRARGRVRLDDVASGTRGRDRERPGRAERRKARRAGTPSETSGCIRRVVAVAHRWAARRVRSARRVPGQLHSRGCVRSC